MGDDDTDRVQEILQIRLNELMRQLKALTAGLSLTWVNEEGEVKQQTVERVSAEIRRIEDAIERHSERKGKVKAEGDKIGNG